MLGEENFMFQENRMGKRLTLFFFIVLFITMMNFSQTILVTSPEEWQNWCLGKKYTISWTKNGNMNSKVNILLYDANTNTKVSNIALSIPNNGFYYWLISNTIIPANYKIIVETVDHAVSDQSDVFVLYDCCRFHFITPPETGNFIAYKNGNLNIQWTSSDCSSGTFIVAVYRVNQSTGENISPGILRVGVSNSSTSYLWHIPNNIISGKYRAVLSYGPYFKESTKFTIMQPYYPFPNRFRSYDLRVIVIPRPVHDSMWWRLHINFKQVFNYLGKLKSTGTFLVEVVKDRSSIRVGYYNKGKFKWVASHTGDVANVKFRKKRKKYSSLVSDKMRMSILIKDLATSRIIKQINLKFAK